MAKKEKEPREYTGINDEIRQEHMKTKDMTFKGKLKYFWYYYKFHTLGAIFGLIFIISIVHDIATSKDYAFRGIMLNSFQLSADALESAFAEYADLDMEEYDCLIDTSSTLSLTRPSQYDMATIQKLVAEVQTKDLDAVVFDAEVFHNYSSNEMFTDLRTVYSQDELAKYQDFLYYIDYAEIKQANAADEESGNIAPALEIQEYTAEDVAREAERHRHPEEMADPIPVGVFVDDSPFAKKSGAYPASIPIFGIITTSERKDTGKVYLDFLWDESIDFAGIVDEGQMFP